MEHENLLRATYEAFNARDIDTALSAMTEDVNWPNAWEGGRLRGHEAVRDYWERQWAVIDPVVRPLTFTARSHGRVAVEVHQLARDMKGTLLSDARVTHTYAFEGALIVHMDVEESENA